MTNHDTMTAPPAPPPTIWQDPPAIATRARRVDLVEHHDWPTLLAPVLADPAGRWARFGPMVSGKSASNIAYNLRTGRVGVTDRLEAAVRHIDDEAFVFVRRAPEPAE